MEALKQLKLKKSFESIGGKPLMISEAQAISELVARKIVKDQMDELENRLQDHLISVSKTLVHDIVEEMRPDILDEVEGTILQKAEQLTKDIKKGDKGDSIKGDKGDKPVAGVDYPIPKNGADGKSIDEKIVIKKVLAKIPKPKDGRDGTNGRNGVDGKNGSPDTPEKIALKINTLDEKIEQKAVKGLLGAFKALQRAINAKKVEGGGGMGNVQHERTTISALTTTVTTAYKIAGGGFALFVYYNGQFLARGIGYTVSGKTISLLFTPDDDTVLDVIYFRT